MGGGERHSLAIAAHLARTHNVDVLTHTPFDPKEMSQRLDLDLTQLRFRELPLDILEKPRRYIAEYDLFINASNGDYIQPVARQNAILVFFPTESPRRLGQRLRRLVARQLDRLATRPRYVNGVYGLGDGSGTSTRGLADQAQIALPAASVQPYTVEFTLTRTSDAVNGATVYIDYEREQELAFNAAQECGPVRLTILPGPERVMTIAAHGDHPGDNAPLHMSPLVLSSRRARAYQRVFVDAWPELSVRYENAMPADIAGIVQGYDLVWANSRYTQRWIHAYWNLASMLLYPPVPVEKYPPGSKKPYILSIGRFFAGNHNKKHLVMIETFKRMVEDGLRGWELHLAGSVTPGVQHRRYLEEAKAAASGSPVHIHADIGNDALITLLGESSVYWHAAGYGENAIRNPGKFEHFGMSVVEAMAAGCAPVVVGQGGLTELVHHGQDGFLWYTPWQLAESTNKLISDDALRSRVAQQAMISSRRFDEAHFRARLDQSMDAMVS